MKDLLDHVSDKSIAQGHRVSWDMFSHIASSADGSVGKKRKGAERFFPEPTKYRRSGRSGQKLLADSIGASFEKLFENDSGGRRYVFLGPKETSCRTHWDPAYIIERFYFCMVLPTGESFIYDPFGKFDGIPSKSAFEKAGHSVFIAEDWHVWLPYYKEYGMPTEELPFYCRGFSAFLMQIFNEIRNETLQSALVKCQNKENSLQVLFGILLPHCSDNIRPQIEFILKFSMRGNDQNEIDWAGMKTFIDEQLKMLNEERLVVERTMTDEELLAAIECSSSEDGDEEDEDEEEDEDVQQVLVIP